jgi:hypothetical protein
LYGTLISENEVRHKDIAILTIAARNNACRELPISGYRNFREVFADNLTSHTHCFVSQFCTAGTCRNYIKTALH